MGTATLGAEDAKRPPGPRAVAAGRRVPLFGRLSLAGQFALAGLVILLAAMLGIGAWVGQEIEASVLRRSAAISALYVESMVEPALQPLASQPRLGPAEIAQLDHQLSDTALGRGIVAFKVWSHQGEVLYSPDRRLIGRSFGIDDDLGQALGGEVAANISDLQDPENEYERERWSRLLQVYVPVRASGSERIIAVAEFYQLPDDLERDLAAARLQSWGVVAAATALIYLLLAGIVKSGSETIARQQAALRHQVAELSRLLEQNARLGERVRQAAGRTTQLNEQALRRVSADLHDGPGQALGLALLRLDSLDEPAAAHCPSCQELAVVQQAVHDALDEIRSISAGLRLPALAPLSLAEVAERAVRDHEQRGGAAVALELGALPQQAPPAIKIALFRSLQEALSNATRHGQGAAVRARVRAEGGQLRLTVSDRGPGFSPEEAEQKERLGLVGMRERTELLGGTWAVSSAPGQGTTLEMSWPLPAAEGV